MSERGKTRCRNLKEFDHKMPGHVAGMILVAMEMCVALIYQTDIGE